MRAAGRAREQRLPVWAARFVSACTFETNCSSSPQSPLKALLSENSQIACPICLYRWCIPEPRDAPTMEHKPSTQSDFEWQGQSRQRLMRFGMWWRFWDIECQKDISNSMGIKVEQRAVIKFLWHMWFLAERIQPILQAVSGDDFYTLSSVVANALIECGRWCVFAGSRAVPWNIL
jgi:hypothetical protein